MKDIIYDIEVFPNFTCLSAYSLQTGKLGCWKNIDEIHKFINIIVIKRNKTLVGYNNKYYDDQILEFIIRKGNVDNIELFNLSQELINNNKLFKNVSFRSIDLFNIIKSGFSAPSLKSVAVNLKHPKIEDLPIDFDKNLSNEEIEKIKEYNKNDVIITKKLWEEVKPRVEMREVLSKKYELDLTSTSDSGIAKAILQNKYKEKENNIEGQQASSTSAETISVGSVIYPWIEFESKELNLFLQNLKDKKISKVKETSSRDIFSLDIDGVKISNNTYTLGLGGLHSQDKPTIISPKPGEILLDLDVASQYPSAIINNKISPRHLNSESFLSVVNELVEERLAHKKRKKESKESDNIQEGLKIAINSIYGFFNSKFFWLFDPKITFTVTLNNQLLLLCLIEKLENNNINIVSANTDGILIYSKEENLDKIREIYKEWEKQTKFQLEETFYKFLVRRDVNNYYAIDISGNSKKLKGIFQPQGGIVKGFYFPIIGKCLQKYFEGEKDIDTFLRNHDDIFDFCASQKISKDFLNILEYVRRTKITHSPKTGKKYKTPKIEDEIVYCETIQPTVRFFVSKPIVNIDGKTTEGYRLRKRKRLENGEFSYTDYVKNYFVELLHNYDENQKYEYKNRIDYSFYKERIQQEINKIENSEVENSKKETNQFIQPILF